MQLLADAMTDEGTDNRVARALCSLLNRKAEISQPLSVLELLNAPIKRLFRNFHQALGFVAHLPDANRHRRITIEAIVNHPIVEPDNITLTQRSMGRDSMNNLLVDRYAKTARENSSGYAVTLERRMAFLLSVNSSATESNSIVVTPGATVCFSSCKTSATIRFARLMMSISRGDLSEITLLVPPEP